MLMYDGRISPVFVSATFTTLPKLPVRFNAFLSSSVNE